MALTAATKTELYQFFAIAFDAAPGVTYMSQLADASNAGMSVQQIVEVFTTKPQFTSVYPNFLTNEQFATKLVDNVVGDSATDAAKSEAIADVEAALSAGWSRGKVIYQIFSNLAAKPADDATWGNTAKMMANQVTVAQYVTEEQMLNTTDLSKLQSVLAHVTATTDVSSPAAIQAAIDGASGHTFILTTAQDDGAEFTGGFGNDTFIANPLDNSGANAATTLNATDKINGGAGIDTLNLTADETHNTVLQGEVKNIEIINIKGSDFIGDVASYITAVKDAQTAADAAHAAADAANEAAIGVNFVMEVLGIAPNNSNPLWNIRDSDNYTDPDSPLNGMAQPATASDVVAIITELLKDHLGEAQALVSETTINAGLAVIQTLIDAAGAPSATIDTIVGAAGVKAIPYFSAAEAATAAATKADTDLTTAHDDLAAHHPTVDASFFEGSTHITVDGEYTDIVNVDGQTITFTGGSIDSHVDVAAGVTEANIVLANTDAEGGLHVYGNALETVTISGNTENDLEDGDLDIYTNATDTLNLDLSNDVYVYVGEDIGKNSSIISTGAGNLELDLCDAGSNVQHIETAGGDDVVYGLTYVTDSHHGFTISTGAGDDEIYIATTGDGSTTVDAGTGDDYVEMERYLQDQDHLDGGAGNDTLSVKTPDGEELVAGTYVRLNAVENFEHLEFQDRVEADAAELTGFESLIFDQRSIIHNAVADQTIELAGDHNDFAVDGEGDVTIDVTSTRDVFCGHTDVVISAVHADITVNAAAVEADVGLTLGGDNIWGLGDIDRSDNSLESADITLASAEVLKDNGDYDHTAEAWLEVDASHMGANFTDLTISGTGYASVDNSHEGATLATIDASGLTSQSINGKDTKSEFVYLGNGAVQEDIIVGDGSVDHITVASTVGDTKLKLMDTIEGLNIVLNDAGNGYAVDSDTLVIAGTHFDYVTYKFDNTPASLQAALNTVSASNITDVNHGVVFAYDGNTYIYHEADADNGDFEVDDTVVKLVGSYDLDVLATALSFN